MRSPRPRRISHLSCLLSINYRQYLRFSTANEGSKPSTPNLSPSTPNLSPSTPNLSPSTPNLSPFTPNLSPFTPNLSPFTPNLSPLFFPMPLILLQKTRFEIKEHLLEHHRTPEHEETPD